MKKKAKKEKYSKKCISKREIDISGIMFCPQVYEHKIGKAIWHSLELTVYPRLDTLQSTTIVLNNVDTINLGNLHSSFGGIWLDLRERIKKL